MQPSAPGGAGLAGLVPGGRPGVGDLHVAALEQRGVQVDHPLRLALDRRAGRVGLDLGLRHVHPEGLQRTGEGAGPGAAGSDHEHHAAPGGRGLGWHAGHSRWWVK